MKKVLFLFAAFFILLVSSYSCVTVDPVIVGNQNTETEYRESDYFEKISVSVPYHVTVKNGLTSSVQIIAESNLIPYIETKLGDKTLYINIEGNTELINHDQIEIIITTPNLNEIRQYDSGEIITDYFNPSTVDLENLGSGTIDAAFNTNELHADVSGSGKIILEGTAETAAMRVSESGSIEAYNFVLYNGDASMTGGGTIFINAKENLNVNISGNGNIYYINYPVIYQNITGFGRLINANN